MSSRKRKRSPEQLEALRVQLRETRRKKHARQKRKYGGIFIEAWSPQFQAWRTYEMASGIEHPGLIDRTPLGFGFFRPTEWPPSSKAQDQGMRGACSEAPRESG